MPITPQAIQELFEELNASRQSRKRAWEILQRLRAILNEADHITVPLPVTRTIDAEGVVLERALLMCLRKRNATLAALVAAVHRFRDAMVKPECKADYPQALQSLLATLEQAEGLVNGW